MKKRLMRLAALVLCACMIFGCMATALAADTFTITIDSDSESKIYTHPRDEAEAGTNVIVYAMRGARLKSVTAYPATGEPIVLKKREGDFTFTMPNAKAVLKAEDLPKHRLTVQNAVIM